MRSANPKGRRSVTPSGSSSKSSRATSISAASMTTRLPNSSIGASARVVVAITSPACIRQALHDLRKGLGAIIGKERKIGHHHQRGVLVGFKHRLGQHPRIQIPQEAGRRAAQPEYVFELEHHGCVLKCERRLAEPRRRDDKAQGAAILEEPRQKARSAPQTVGNHSVGAPPLASALLDETGHGHLLLLSALANNRSHLTRPRLSGQPARNIRPPIPFHCRPDKPPATCRQPRKRHPQAQGTREEGPWQASPVICGKASAPFALRASDKQSNGTRATALAFPSCHRQKAASAHCRPRRDGADKKSGRRHGFSTVRARAFPRNRGGRRGRQARALPRNRSGRRGYKKRPLRVAEGSLFLGRAPRAPCLSSRCRAGPIARRTPSEL